MRYGTSLESQNDVSAPAAAMTTANPNEVNGNTIWRRGRRAAETTERGDRVDYDRLRHEKGRPDAHPSSNLIER
eukprot:scaffold13786_cov126-Skeletonema_marinoi.AAC.6